MSHIMVHGRVVHGRDSAYVYCDDDVQTQYMSHIMVHGRDSAYV